MSWWVNASPAGFTAAAEQRTAGKSEPVYVQKRKRERVPGSLRDTGQTKTYHRDRKRALVSKGKCAWCGKARKEYAYLCDGCQQKRYRDRRRRDAAKKATAA